MIVKFRELFAALLVFFNQVQPIYGQRRDPTTYCPFSWGEFGSYCYGLRLLSLSWKDAFNACEQSKSDLIYINSLDELDFVLQLVRDRLVHSTQQSTARVWTSFSTFQTISKKAVAKTRANVSFDWILANSTRKHPNPEIVRGLKFQLSAAKNNNDSVCGYIDIGAKSPNGAGFLALCDNPLPTGSGIVHGYICKQERLPVKGSFFGDVFVPDDSDFAGYQRDAVSNNQPVPPAAYWPGGEPVPYFIDSEFRQNHKSIIKLALSKFEKSVCGLKFRERKPDEPNGDYISYLSVARPGLCGSALGRIRGAQNISLGSDCFNDLGTVIHETMHALGIPHEHQRPDRDQYIRVEWENIDFSKKNQFYKYRDFLPPWLKVTYDIGSVMHYGPYDFSALTIVQSIEVLPNATISYDNPAGKQKITNGNLIIGQRKHLSKHDIEKLDNLFPCDANGKPIASTHRGVVESLTREQLIPALKRNPKCFVEYDRDIISGVGLKTLGNQPKEACCDLCVADKNCRGFAWNDWQNGTCFLKSASGPMIQLDRVIAGYVIARQNESIEDESTFDEQHCTTLYGIDIHGGDAVGTISGQYSFACCRLCEANSRCQAYSWTAWNGGTCFLKSASEPQVKDPNVQSGVLRSRLLSTATRVSPAPQPTCYLSRGKDITPGVNLASHSVRRQGECCALCGNTPGCKAFTWTEYSAGTCWLKNSTMQTTEGEDVPALGFLQDSLQSDLPKKSVVVKELTTSMAPSSLAKHQNQCDYRAGYDVGIGTTMRIEKNLRITACCDMCWSNYQCQAFSWAFYGNGTCYLKKNKLPFESVSGVFSGLVHSRPCKMVENKDIDGGELVGQVSNVLLAESCCRICQTTAKCKGFAWNDYQGGTCWLKSVDGPMVDKTNVKAGFLM